MKGIIAEKAKSKEIERKTTLQKSEKSNMPAIHTDEEVAKIAQLSRSTIRQAETIVKQGTKVT